MNDRNEAIARRFSKPNGLFRSCVWGAGGYMIFGKDAIAAAASFRSASAVSEQAICHTAKVFAGFLSSPPLVWQCSNGRLVTDSVQMASIEKVLTDRRVRSLLTSQFRALVDRGKVANISLPSWILEECVV